MSFLHPFHTTQLHIIFLFIIAICFTTSCNTSNIIKIETSQKDRIFQETKYFYLNEHQLKTEFIADESIEPIEGWKPWKEQFYQNLNANIKSNEANRNVSILRIKLNPFGTVLDFDVPKSPSLQVDAAIKQAFSDTLPQFTSPKLNGKAIACIIEMPVLLGKTR